MIKIIEDGHSNRNLVSHKVFQFYLIALKFTHADVEIFSIRQVYISTDGFPERTDAGINSPLRFNETLRNFYLNVYLGEDEWKYF